MNRWPDTDGAAITRYLGQLRLSCPTSPTYYRQALQSFQDVVVHHQPPKVSRPVLETWLHERSSHWPVATLLHRARIIDRFLDFLAEEKLIASNPVADLRNEYCVKSGKAIWRALLAPNPEKSLESARQLPAFGSALGSLMQDHIALMRTRGFRYETAARWLWRFDRFLQTRPELAAQPVSVMLQHWSATCATPNHIAECEKLGHILRRAQHLPASSSASKRPVSGAQKEVERKWRQPHIYSPEEICRLLDIARNYPSPRAPLRPISFYTMLVLAYCAGLRLGELARLNVEDVDLQSGTIAIRETKFFKSRTLPLTDSVLSALREYLAARCGAKAPQSPDSALFWHDKGDERYTTQGIAWVLVDVLRRAHLKPPKGKTGPRIHDLRHSMVVNRILQWYRAGINPQDKLPFLATYLGHRDIHSTLVYITVTQDLLQQANERFRALGAGCLNVHEEVEA